MRGGELPPVLWHWHVSLLSQKKRKKKVETHTSIIGNEIANQLANDITTLDEPTPTPHMHMPHTIPYCLIGTPIGAHNKAIYTLQAYMHKENREI